MGRHSFFVVDGDWYSKRYLNRQITSDYQEIKSPDDLKLNTQYFLRGDRQMRFEVLELPSSREDTFTIKIKTDKGEECELRLDELGYFTQHTGIKSVYVEGPIEVPV